MSASNTLVELLQDNLRRMGPITARRMFGGAGVYAEGVMFGLIADETLYFKADEQNRPDFVAEGMAAFSYATSNGRNTIMSYWCVPERLFDDPDEMLTWAQRALAAANRSRKPKKARRSK